MELRTGSKQLIRDINVTAVVDCVRRFGPISRVDIAKRTGLGHSTITGLVNMLLSENLLIEVGSAESSGGRKPVLLELNAHARFAVGAKLAPEMASAAVCDLRARVIARSQRPVSRDQSPAEVLGAVIGAIRDALAIVGVHEQKVLGVGLALPGIVDPATGTSVSPTFFRWANLAVRHELQTFLGLPVIVENDANVFALAEYLHGAGKGFRHLVCVTVGAGVGAGLIAGGSLYRGAIAGAGELGHITIDERGPLCICGNHGCLEAFASDQAIVRAAGQTMAMSEITREKVVTAAQAGDLAAKKILRQAGMHLGVGLANALNILNPQRIVVGGEAVHQAGDLLLEPLRKALRSRAFSVLADGVEVVPSALGSDAWVVGAATLILEELFRPPIYEGGVLPHVVAISRLLA